MVKAPLRNIILLLSLLLTLPCLYAQDLKAHLSVELSDKKLYIGQTFTYNIVLTTNNPEIDFAYPVTNIDRSGLTYCGSPRMYGGSINAQRTKDGLYKLTIAQISFRCDTKGKIKIPGGQYQLGFIETTQGRDPFWGFMRYRNIRKETLTVPDISINVKALPTKGSENFSGAVGEFSIHSRLPRTSASVGTRVQVVYTIEGYGDLADIHSPLDGMQFPEGIELRDIKTDTRSYFQNGQLYTVLRYICLLSGTQPGSYTLPELRFEFFNPDTGSYQTIRTTTERLRIEEGTERSRPPQDYQYI